MSTYHLGEFEEIVLLTVAILNGQGYGNSIINEIEQRLKRNVSLGAMQTVLKRLEEKQLVSSVFGESTENRGGKRKRLYNITSEGKILINQSKEQRNELWNAIPNIALKFC